MIFGTNLKIYNDKNDLIDLDDVDTIFSVNPDGFGATLENNIFNAGASFKSGGIDLKASSLKLNIYFGLGDTNSEMIEYRKFIDFLNYPPYRLVYTIEGADLLRDCILNEITKSDINANQVLLEQVVFDFLTPFYREISETYKPNSDTEGDGKIYLGLNRPRNLIINPNFLNNMENWSNMSDPEGIYQIQTPASDKPTSNILKLTSSNNKLSSFINAWGLEVKKGDRLSFRVDIKTENNPDYDRPVIRVGYGTGEKNYKYSDFGITASSSGFETAAISFVVPEDGVFQLYLINQNWSTLGAMSTYFREPMLIRGDVANLPVDQYDDSYPNLNLLDGTKIFSGYWGNTAGWYDDGTYQGLSVKSSNNQWNGIYKSYTIPTPGDYTLSEFVKSDDESSQIHRYVLINEQYVSDTIIGSQFDWKRDSCILEGLNAGDVVYIKYENAIYNSQKISVAGYKIEYGSETTPWMPSSSEVQPTDYPSFLSGFYEGKQSDGYYAYPFVYESDYNGKSGVFQIENNSVYIGSAKGSPVEITVHGPCTNPYWEILDGSEVLQSDGYNIDVPDGYKLVVSSIVQNQRMKLIAPDGTISNVYQQQDLSKTNLIAIPEGKTTLAFHNVGDVSFTYREEYITV
jgi:hypothetical protein